MTAGRGGGRAARIAREARSPTTGMPGVTSHGGRNFEPLTESDVARIHRAALRVLETVGMGMLGEQPPGVKAMLEQGATLDAHGRVRIPEALVEDALAGACRHWTLHALDLDRALEIAPGQTHYGTAGGAVSILDFHQRHYRDTTLVDLYDAARLIDTLANISWCYRPLVARDLDSLRALDVNTAYALAAGTTKPWGITFSLPQSVAPVIELFEMARGRPGSFFAEPCCHSVQGAGVPPLQYAYDRCLIKEAVIRAGVPLMIASAPQAGATAPAALAGTMVQVVAEALAGLVYVQAIAPGHPITFAPWPFVSDLRTGAMSGGGAEQALLMGAAAQMGHFYDLPCSVAAGMTDAKIADAQAGFEKASTNLIAGIAGAGMVHESAGMHASLLGCALESFVIDNEMLGGIKRAVRGIEVNDETLSLQTIAEVNVEGPGHYLGHQQTLALMQSEYHYPALSDRQAPAAWQDSGSSDILERARTVALETLSSHYPDHLAGSLDRKIRERFDIHLAPARMRPGSHWAKSEPTVTGST
ncbi:MAG TPA: methyltransferase [Gammaproteobacteria bacterium]|nr:trimethylamine methyltransferase family protein [Arenicellales bacterium]HCV19907.1 methyltransferase [Gammaproteobacteria bacterium]MDP6313378.1 trimethylamine methyltransferase family protein [Arenicellales bacterium]MDP7120071.1 trimethylamine methyltransferase family protein [Arenicellales bacterium]MDP7191955.1 trimethylamine methyltransferase family protein [Arenicellales bacterium]